MGHKKAAAGGHLPRGTRGAGGQPGRGWIGRGTCWDGVARDGPHANVGGLRGCIGVRVRVI